MDRVRVLGCRFHGDERIAEEGVADYWDLLNHVEVGERGQIFACDSKGEAKYGEESMTPRRIRCFATLPFPESISGLPQTCGETLAEFDESEGEWKVTRFGITLWREVVA